LFGPQTLGISLLNGIDGHEIMGRELPGRTVVGGSAYVSAVIAAPGKLRYTSDMSAITFGAPTDAALRAKATAFIDSCGKAGFKADMVDDVMSSLWGKFIGLSTNAALTTAARQGLAGGHRRNSRGARGLQLRNERERRDDRGRNGIAGGVWHGWTWWRRRR